MHNSVNLILNLTLSISKKLKVVKISQFEKSATNRQQKIDKEIDKKSYLKRKIVKKLAEKLSMYKSKNTGRHGREKVMARK